jgi:hypothetical protein
MVVLSSCCEMFGSVLKRTQSSNCVKFSQFTTRGKRGEEKIMSNNHDPYEVGLYTCYNDKHNNATLEISSESESLS